MLRNIFLAMAALLLLGIAFVFWMKHERTEISLALLPNPAENSADATQFSLMIYNIQTRPVMDDGAEKLPQISPLLNGYDIVAIQECFQKHDLLWAQAQHPNKAYFGELSKFWKLANSGLSMLSALPISEVKMQHFEHVGEFQNYIASKGVMMVRVVQGGKTLDVYNTHMEAGDTEAAHVARDGQVQELIDFINTNSPPEHSVLLCGDFNIGPHRAGKTLAEYSPNHYSSEVDMQRRTAAFERMRNELELMDVHDVLLGRVNDDIERFLYRPGKGHDLVPLTLEFPLHFQRADGTALSDGSPKVATFQFSKK